MITVRVLAAATVALAAAGVAPAATLSASGAHGTAAYPGGVGRVDDGPGPAGRSSFRNVDHSRFMGQAGDWGFAHAHRERPRGFEEWRRRGHRDRRGAASGYPYGFGYGYGDDSGSEDAYAREGDSERFGPQEPYGEGFYGRYASTARPMASALAPLAYGPGAHDGAYAYGYNGYAQTPSLFDGAGPVGPVVLVGGRTPCGC